jgi:hypothetical protein
MPGLAAGAGGLSQHLALTVRAFESAEIRALPTPTLVTKKVMLACCACARPPTPAANAALRQRCNGLSSSFVSPMD